MAYAHKAKNAAAENQQILDPSRSPVEFNLSTALYCIAESLEHLELEMRSVRQELRALKQTVDWLPRKSARRE